MTALGEAVLIAWACMAVAMTLLWLAQLRTGDASIVDVGWAFGTGAVAVALVTLTSVGDPTRRWLANMDLRRDRIEPILESVYGADAALWWVRWRVFFMACAELFGYAGGQEWWVSHYLFGRTGR